MIIFFFFISLISRAVNENFYTLLGVPTTATKKHIKRAWRQKALLSHPDKQCADTADEKSEACVKNANELFIKTRRAYEVLSDKKSRAYYDRTGQDPDEERAQPFWQRFASRFRRRRPRLNDFERLAQSRVTDYNGIEHLTDDVYVDLMWEPQKCYIPSWISDIKIMDTSVFEAQSWCEADDACSAFTYRGWNEEIDFEKIRTIWFKDAWEALVDVDFPYTTWKKPEGGRVLEKNLLLAIYEPGGECEEILTFKVKFPYPFAHWQVKSRYGGGGLWWEDILTTGKIPWSEAAEFFGITSCPGIVFIPKGSTLNEFKKLETSYHRNFETWVWDHLQVEMQIFNRFRKKVHVLWLKDSSAVLKGTIEPGEWFYTDSFLSHEWWIRDSDIEDRMLTKESSLAVFKVSSMEPHDNIFEVPDVSCYDKMGQCKKWARHGECRKNPEYMQENCQISCGTCPEEKSDEENGKSKRREKQEL